MITDRMADVAAHYDSTDTSVELERAELEEGVEDDPMVTTSVRLPKSLLDWVREQAEGERMKPTALIRRWIEEQRDASEERRDASEKLSLAERVMRLELTLSILETRERTAEDKWGRVDWLEHRLDALVNDLIKAKVLEPTKVPTASTGAHDSVGPRASRPGASQSEVEDSSDHD